MASKRTGRPKNPLKPAGAHVTRRVRHLIDLAHDGNIHEAARASGLPYPTLRALYVGKNASPRLKTLEKLAAAYGVYVDWFTNPESPKALPMGGVVAPISARPNGRYPMPERSVTIPWAAWPLPDIMRRIGNKLEALPPSPDRPILGTLTDPKAAERRLVEFFLAPLLEAEAIGVKDCFLLEPGPVKEWDERNELVAKRMRRLGLFWQETLSGLFV